MKLSDQLNKYCFSSDLVKISDLIENAKGEISFWGKRLVKVSGLTGSVSLEEIARKLIKANGNLCQIFDIGQDSNLTFKEKLNGQLIVNRLEGLYEDTDSKLKNTNFFTRLLNFFSELSFSFNTPRSLIENACVYHYS